jgi:hypothetical protein
VNVPDRDVSRGALSSYLIDSRSNSCPSLTSALPMTYPTQTNTFTNAMAEHGPPQMLEQRIIDLLYTFCENSAKNQNTPITLTPEDAPESLSQKEKQELNILARKSSRHETVFPPQLTRTDCRKPSFPHSRPGFKLWTENRRRRRLRDNAQLGSVQEQSG